MVSVFRVIDTILKLHVFSLTCLFNISVHPTGRHPVMWDGMCGPRDHGLPQALFVTAGGEGSQILMLHLWRAEAGGLGYCPRSHTALGK